MSDYMFMLESHLSADQHRALQQVQAAAADAGVNVFLTGGAMRDMLGGFRIRDLDFSVEGPALKLAKTLQDRGARTIEADELRRSAELIFPGGVTAQIAMSRKERYARTGAKPQITPVTIQEDLRGRDFTVNAMALSLNRASRGLLLDPTNGLADLGRREFRATHPYVFYDDPGRLLRLTRLRVRLSFTVEDRTRLQVENARVARIEASISAGTLREELKAIAAEPSPAAVLQALDEDGLLSLFSPALAGEGTNLQALIKMERASKLVEESNVAVESRLGPFLLALTAEMTPKQKSALLKSLGIPKAEIEQMRSLEPQARRLERTLKSARVMKPSQVYQSLVNAPMEQIVFLLGNSTHRTVQERIRNYLQKYLPTMQEVSQSDWDALEGRPGTPKHMRSRQSFLASHLDVHPKRPAAEPILAATDVSPERGRGR